MFFRDIPQMKERDERFGHPPPIYVTAGQRRSKAGR